MLISKEYFSDIVGVSLSNAPVEEIVLKVSNKAYGYIVTKPLHESQSAVSIPIGEDYWQVILKVRIIMNFVPYFVRLVSRLK